MYADIIAQSKEGTDVLYPVSLPLAYTLAAPRLFSDLAFCAPSCSLQRCLTPTFRVSEKQESHLATIL